MTKLEHELTAVVLPTEIPRVLRAAAANYRSRGWTCLADLFEETADEVPRRVRRFLQKQKEMKR